VRFPEGFAAVAAGFTLDAESFKFSRSVLKILELFLETRRVGEQLGNDCSQEGGMSSKDRVGAPGGMDRRDFLKLGGVGIAGAALLGVVGSSRIFAQAGSPYSSLVAEFEEAASRYDVPMKLLLAMGYVNTRWEMPPPGASAHEPGNPHGRGAYGIMQLVKNDEEDTLGEASRLTGISEEDLKTDRKSNIFGGAALLAEAEGTRPARLGDYFGAVSGKGKRRFFKAVAGLGAGELYAEQVFDTLRSGTFKTILDGEQVSLPGEVEL
jgi:hypothetical protein